MTCIRGRLALWIVATVIHLPLACVTLQAVFRDGNWAAVSAMPFVHFYRPVPLT